jgi:hypothetical protein
MLLQQLWGIWMSMKNQWGRRRDYVNRHIRPWFTCICSWAMMLILYMDSCLCIYIYICTLNTPIKHIVICDCMSRAHILIYIYRYMLHPLTMRAFEPRNNSNIQLCLYSQVCTFTILPWTFRTHTSTKHAIPHLHHAIFS